MAIERRSNLKLVASQDFSEDDQVPEKSEEFAITGTSLTASAVVALVVTGVGYGFFDWMPLWVHVLVFASTFGLMLVYGRRMACCG